MSNSQAKTILVVEDDQFLREIISAKLEKSGYRVLQAISGEQGVEIATSEHPLLILLDLILPSISGFEVMAQLQQSETTKQIPVIVISNYAELESKKRSEDLHAIDYLVKAQLNPVDILNRVDAFFKAKD